MISYFFLALIGLCAGGTIASGITGFIIGISLIPRYAGITHTGKHILLYEDFLLAGIFLGNLMSLFSPVFPFHTLFFVTFGLFSGIFLGGWVMALAEMADIFPIFFRKLNLCTGHSLVIYTLALSKVLGSLYFYIFYNK